MVWFSSLTGFAKDSVQHHKAHTLHDMVRKIHSILNILKERVSKCNQLACSVPVWAQGRNKGKFSGGFGKREEKLIE